MKKRTVWSYVDGSGGMERYDGTGRNPNTCWKCGVRTSWRYSRWDEAKSDFDVRTMCRECAAVETVDEINPALFVAGKDGGTICRYQIEGEKGQMICFPERGSARPKPGEVWDVEFVKVLPSGKAGIVRPVTCLGVGLVFESYAGNARINGIYAHDTGTIMVDQGYAYMAGGNIHNRYLVYGATEAVEKFRKIKGI